MVSRFEHWKGRCTRLALVILVHGLAVLLGYFLSPPIQFKKPEPELQVTLLPALEEKQEKKASPRTAKRSEAAPKPVTIPVPEPIVELPMMMVSSDVFRASDISRIRSAPSENAGAELAAGDSDRSIGTAPGGARMYEAEWYRRAPTEAEINGYLPKDLRQSGWALIVCQTIPDYRVEDCRELDEFPRGSGLARSMRLASWQFRVRPTRINGKPQIGTWVRIRFDLTYGFSN